MGKNELQDMMKMEERYDLIAQRYNLIEFSGDLRQLEGEFKQLDKRLDDSNKRIDDIRQATKVWIMIITIILAGLNITVLVVTLLM